MALELKMYLIVVPIRPSAASFIVGDGVADQERYTLGFLGFVFGLGITMAP